MASDVNDSPERRRRRPHADHDKRLQDLMKLPTSELVTLFEGLLPANSAPSRDNDSSTLPSKQGVRVFLSYARPDKPLVLNLFRRLQADGFAPWMDTECLRGGQKWLTAIEREIRAAHFFLCCLSPNSLQRRGTMQREIRLARDRAMDMLQKDAYFIPVRLVQCDIPAECAEYQVVDLFEPDGYVRLTRSLWDEFSSRDFTNPA